MRKAKIYLTGTVELFLADKGYGFIRDIHDVKRYFIIQDVKNKIELKKGEKVRFVPTNGKSPFGIYLAKDVQINNAIVYLEGIVMFFNEDKNTGFIKDIDGVERIFYLDKVQNKIVLKKGQKVKFIPYNRINGKESAKDIYLIKEKDLPVEEDNTALFKEVRDNWMLEAKFEDVLKYFYHLDELEQILQGKKCFIIGRKGTGKTAISEYLLKQKSFECFTEKLDFKNFKFNELYDKNDPGFPFQSQYITVWKLLIYGSILKMMSYNDTLDSKLLKTLREIFPIDSIDSLSKTIKRTSTDFKVELFEVLIKKETIKVDEKEFSWIEKVDLFETIIFNHIDTSKYVIIMDALDEDYNDPYNSNNTDRTNKYFHLLTGLYKAVQEIKAKFQFPDFNIQPIVFLRDDIYRQIEDNDKFKWRDSTLPLMWNKFKIQNMLAYRISRSISKDGDILPFEDAWYKLFPDRYIETQKGANKDIFDFIVTRTFIRPRDFINFIKMCCEKAINNGQKQINAPIIVNAAKSLSRGINDEIQHEIKGLMFDIREIMEVLQLMGRYEFETKEFITLYNEFVEQGKMKQNIGVEIVLRNLFNYNIIGNRLKGIEVYQMFHPNLELNLKEKLLIHPALRASLFTS